MTSCVFLEPHEKLVVAIEPRKGSFNYPPPRSKPWVLSLHLDLFATLLHVGDIPSGFTFLFCRVSCIAFVCTKMLSSPHTSRRPSNDDTIQCVRQQFHVVHLSPADDEGQRDSTTVDKYASLAPIFSPDPSGSDQLFPEQGEPCSCHRQYTAIARRFPPFRRIQQDRSSTASGRIPRPAIPENTDVLRLGYQIFLWEVLSIARQFSERRQSQQRQFAMIWAFCHHRACEGTSGAVLSFCLGSAAQLSPRIHPTLPTIADDEHVVFPCKKYH